MTLSSSPALPPLSEADIAEYLSNTPEFFLRHAEVLASVTISSPHGGRAVSLHERQAELLREKIRSLEHRIMEMVRHGTENTSLAQKIHEWTCTLARVAHPSDLPQAVQSLALTEAVIPGLAPEPSIFAPPEQNIFLWHFMFNQLADLPETLGKLLSMLMGGKRQAA